MLLFAAGLLGCAVFAASGALVAARSRMDYVGLVTLALATALGGGTLRDVILGARVFWVREPVWIAVSLGAAVLTLLVGRVLARHEKTLLWADAIGLSLFAATGSLTALDLGAPLLVAGLLGVASAVAGGVIRDVIARRDPLILYPGEFYVTAASAGAIATLAVVSLGGPRDLALAAGFAACLVLRAGSLQWGWKVGGVPPVDP